jgi:hypothetical protein
LKWGFSGSKAPSEAAVEVCSVEEKNMGRFTITKEGKEHAYSREFARTLRMAMRDLHGFGLTNEQIMGQIEILVALALCGLDPNTALAEKDGAELDAFGKKHGKEMDAVWQAQKKYIEAMVRTEIRIKTSALGVTGLSEEEFGDLLLGVYGKI